MPTCSRCGMSKGKKHFTSLNSGRPCCKYCHIGKSPQQLAHEEELKTEQRRKQNEKKREQTERVALMNHHRPEQLKWTNEIQQAETPEEVQAIIARHREARLAKQQAEVEERRQAAEAARRRAAEQLKQLQAGGEATAVQLDRAHARSRVAAEPELSEVGSG